MHLTFDVGPLQAGRELITRLTTSIDNTETGGGGGGGAAGPAQPIVYTDDNALEFVRRRTNLQQEEPIPSSYYPMAASVFIRDEPQDAAEPALQLTVLTERAHGAASLARGELEVMLHRRCSGNDGKGNGENLDETDHISPSLLLLLSPTADAAADARRLSLLQNFPPTATFSPAASVQAYSARASTRVVSRLLAQPLPPNVHLLSMDQRYGPTSETVLRLQHIFEAGDRDEHSHLTAPVTLDLAQ